MSDPSQQPATPPEPNQRATPRPRETLSGDRLCMHCFHPLVGAPIERDEKTGLLYVRCGECGGASALFEYPTVGPWLRRMKAVLASTLVFIAMFGALATFGISLGFSFGAAESACDVAGERLAERYRALAGGSDDPSWGSGGYGRTDMKWIATDEGQAELAAIRFAPGAFIAFSGILAIAAAVLFPFVLFFGVALTRRAAVTRALACALLVGLGGAVAATLAMRSGNPAIVAAYWTAVAKSSHAAFFAALAAAVLACYAAVVGVLAPAVAAQVARFILPPGDRRLLAWLWEWRGKTVPRD